MFTWLVSKPRREPAAGALLRRDKTDVHGTALLSVSVLWLLCPQYAAAEEKLSLSLSRAAAKCLIEHKPSYMAMGYDPVVIEPEACPTIRFKELDFSLLARNSGEKKEVLIVYKAQLGCLIEALQRSSELEGHADSVIEVTINPSEDCSE